MALTRDLAPYEAAIEGLYDRADPRTGPDWTSSVVIAIGVALATFGAWPRRRTSPAP